MIITNDAIEKCNYFKYLANETLNLISKYSSESQILITRAVGINISTRYGQIENIKFNDDNTLGITIYYKQSKGYATSNNLKEQNIPNIISKAINISCYTSPDPCFGLANKFLLAYHDIDLDLFHPIECNIKKIIKLVAKTEKIALKYDKRIIHTEGANFNSCTMIRTIANTHGLLQSYSSTQYSLSCGVIARDNNNNMERNYAYTLNRSFEKLHSPQQVGEECARRVLKNLNSQKITTTEAPVLFEAEIATSLFEHLIDAISGKNVYKKSTFLLHYLGKIILPNWLCIKECPHIPAEIASSPFDDEGVKTTDRTIVKNGMLCTWLLDSYSARKLKLNSTGYSNNTYNWYINYQNINFEKLITKMHTGLVVTNLMGHGINITTGDYSRGASGFWIKNGEIQYPVSEITIAGNLKDMFLNIISIGNDIETRSNIKCGSILISSIKIAGQ